jgi:hypothetical protein
MREGVFPNLLRRHYLRVVHVDLIHAIVNVCTIELSEDVLPELIICHKIPTLVLAQKLI